MFGKKLVSDALLATVKEVTSGEQIDSSGNELLIGDGVTVQEGPHAGRTGMISGFQNTGRSEVQLDHGPSVAIYNEVLLNEGGMFTKGKGLIDPKGGYRKNKPTKAQSGRTLPTGSHGSRSSAFKQAVKTHGANDKDVKSLEALYKKRDNLLKKNGNTDRIDKHIGSVEWNFSNNEEYEFDEAMSPAEITRRRKEQKREVVRGKRKSGKTSDKMYDYELRKSEGKPVNVPKNTTEGLDAVDKKALKKKFKNREDQDIDNDGDEDESDEYLHNRRQTVGKKISKRKGKKKNGNGNGNGEKIEINPDMEEQAHSRNERIIEVIKDALKKNIRIEEGRHGVGSDEATQEYKDATPGQSGEFEDALDYDKYSADNFIVPDDEVDDMLEKGSYFKP